VKSFDQAFNESYEISVIRKAGPEQLRMLMLAAESIRADRKTGAVHIEGNRYWSEALIDHAGKLLTVRFDPDDLHAGVSVYRSDGAFITDAECIEAVGFADRAAAREHARRRREFSKATRTIARLENELNAADVAAALKGIETDETPSPETKIVRMFSGNAALASRLETAADSETEEVDQDRFEAAFSRSLSVLAGGRQE
jgi:hypothetical protein